MNMIWKNPDGSLAIMTFAVPLKGQKAIEDAKARIIGKGKYAPSDYVGFFERNQLPDTRYIDAWRYSAGAIVVKQSLVVETK